MTFIDYDGIEHESYEAYLNSPNLDPDIIYSYLARGIRTPQNETELEWQKEAQEIKKNGGSFELYFN